MQGKLRAIVALLLTGILVAVPAISIVQEAPLTPDTAPASTATDAAAPGGSDGTTVAAGDGTGSPTATADQHVNEEQRTLDVDADGTATDAETGDESDLTVEVDGEVTVRESEEGVDETAATEGQTVQANVTIGGTTYTIPVQVNGEGTSFEAAGIFDAESWRLHAQGQSFGQVADGSGATFFGNMTLVGTNGGDFVVMGDGVLTVQDQAETTTYDLEFQGTATFD